MIPTSTLAKKYETYKKYERIKKVFDKKPINSIKLIPIKEEISNSKLYLYISNFSWITPFFCNLNMIVFESSFIIFSLYLIYQNRYKNQVLWCTWSYFWCIWYFYSFLWSIWLHFTWTLKIFKTTTIFKCLEFHLIHKYYFFIRILWIYISLENYA